MFISLLSDLLHFELQCSKLVIKHLDQLRLCIALSLAIFNILPKKRDVLRSEHLAEIEFHVVQLGDWINCFDSSWLFLRSEEHSA